MASQTRVTELLVALHPGHREALDEPVPLIYNELREIAHRKLRHERSGHTPSTTALVHEAYLKLVQLDRIQWQSRAHFLAIAAKVGILMAGCLRTTSGPCSEPCAAWPRS